jgi:hypothetical protein
MAMSTMTTRETAVARLPSGEPPPLAPTPGRASNITAIANMLTDPLRLAVAVVGVRSVRLDAVRYHSTVGAGDEEVEEEFGVSGGLPLSLNVINAARMAASMFSPAARKPVDGGGDAAAGVGVASAPPISPKTAAERSSKVGQACHTPFRTTAPIRLFRRGFGDGSCFFPGWLSPGRFISWLHGASQQRPLRSSLPLHCSRAFS